jgi:predicted nuclease with TOPRIM domain
MPDERITVEWISTAQQMLATIQKVDAKLENQEKVMQKLTDTSKKGAEAAAGSFNKLEQMLRKNESALKDMALGSSQFDTQKAKVDRLRESYEKIKATLSGKTGAKDAAIIPDQKGSLADIESQLKAVEAQLKRTAATSGEFKKLEVAYGNLKKRHDEMTASLKSLGKEAPKVAVDATGSFNKLEKELRESEEALQALSIGSDAFNVQKAKVDELRASLKNAKKELQTIEPEVVALAGSFNRLEKEVKDNEEELRKLAIGSAEFDKQKRKVDALRESLDKANKSLKSGKESPWPEIGIGMATATGAAFALFAALSKVADKQREIVAAGADQAVNLDTLARKMQIQAGLNDEQRQQDSIAVIQQSSKAGLRAEAGFQAATQLSGSGFVDPVKSGSLQTILNTMQASSFQGSPEELVSAFAEALNAYGLDKTNANLQQIAVSAQSLFKQTDFQLTELQDFAKNASVFEGANIKIDEALAGFTALREVLPAAESGTGLRNFVNKLQAGDLTKENKQNLERIGVNAGQVDFVGESLTQVLQTVKDATDKMPEADRNAALGKMFGTENVASARLLINSVSRIEQLRKSQQNAQQFNADLATASGGMQAERNRIENQKLIDLAPKAEKLNELDLGIKRFDAQLLDLENKAAATGNAFAGTAAAASGGVLSRANVVVGGDVVPQVNEGLFQVFSSFFRTQEDVQRQQLEEQRRMRAAMEAQQARPQQRPPQPAVRPKEAPLPAATAP